METMQIGMLLILFAVVLSIADFTLRCLAQFCSHLSRLSLLCSSCY